MHLIIGGAYQGKQTFARETYGFGEEQIGTCTQDSVDFSKPCIRAMEAFVWGCVIRGEDAVAVFRENREAWQNSVLIIRDISGGIVPVTKQERAWREQCGRLCQYLSREADRVSRIFCGLEERLK